MNEKYKCPVCNGEPVPDLVLHGITFTNGWCEFCQGKKDLNWIETIFGVDPEYRLDLLRRMMLKGDNDVNDE